MDATLEAVLIQIAFFVISVIGAWIVLGLLKGTAQIQHKGAQFGGAAAMFIAMFFLLNRYVPQIRDGIISEARASQSQSVVTKNANGSQDTLDIYLSPDKQIISERDLNALDKNNYSIDDKLGVAVARQTTAGWITGEIPLVERVSAIDQPFMGYSISNMRKAAGIDNIRGTVFAVERETSRAVVLDADSEIAGVRLSANPFDDPQFVKNAFMAQIESAATLSGSEELKDPNKISDTADALVSATGDTLKIGVQKFIDRSIPITKHLRAGVYVSTFSAADLLSLKGFLGSFASSLTTLDRALAQFAMNGLFMGGGRNLKVDQQRNIASFNGSTNLQHVLIDGKKRDATLNDIGFVVAGPKQVLFVQLLCLDIDGLDTALQLKRIMDSLLFVIS